MRKTLVSQHETGCDSNNESKGACDDTTAEATGGEAAAAGYQLTGEGLHSARQCGDQTAPWRAQDRGNSCSCVGQKPNRSFTLP
jgi:hypothetical protein